MTIMNEVHYEGQQTAQLNLQNIVIFSLIITMKQYDTPSCNGMEKLYQNVVLCCGASDFFNCIFLSLFNACVRLIKATKKHDNLIVMQQA